MSAQKTRNNEKVLQSELTIPHPPELVFPFFSRAENLQKITPPSLKFAIKTPLPVEMKAGALIDYRISLLGIPMNWRTEITIWEPPFRFVDTQLKGPYHTWIHEHKFEATPEGHTRMMDTVRYRLPLAPLSEPAHWLFVRAQVRSIFRYREKIIADLFGTPSSPISAEFLPV